jgi:hypothetical protein
MAVQTVSGRLPTEVVRRTVSEDFKSVQSCDDDGSAVEPSRPDGLLLIAGGSLLLRFVIGRDGSVSVASLENDERAVPSLQACILRAARALRFPRPDGGIVTVVGRVSWTYWPRDWPEK